MEKVTKTNNMVQIMAVIFIITVIVTGALFFGGVL